MCTAAHSIGLGREEWGDCRKTEACLCEMRRRPIRLESPRAEPSLVSSDASKAFQIPPGSLLMLSPSSLSLFLFTPRDFACSISNMSMYMQIHSAVYTHPKQFWECTTLSCAHAILNTIVLCAHTCTPDTQACTRLAAKQTHTRYMHMYVPAHRVLTHTPFTSMPMCRLKSLYDNPMCTHIRTVITHIHG